MSVKTRKAHNKVEFLDHQILSDPMSQKIMETMKNIDIRRLGINGKDSTQDGYHF